MMKNLPIGKKLWIGFGGILCVTLLSSGWTYITSKQLDSAIDENVQEVRLLGDIERYRYAITAAHTNLLELLISGDIDYFDIIDRYLGKIDGQRDGVMDSLEAAGRSRDTLGDIEENVAAWREETLAKQLMEVGSPLTFDMARLREAMTDNKQRWFEIDEAFEHIDAELQASVAARRDQQAGLQMALEFGSLASALFLMVFCCAMAVVMQRSVAIPVRRLGEVTSRLKDKDFDVGIDGTDRGDEVGDLARALDLFREQGRHNEEVEAEQARDAEEKIRHATVLTNAVRGFRDSSSGLLSKLSGAGVELNRAAQSLDEVVGASFDYTKSVSSAASATGGSVESVAAAIEEMTASIQDISVQLTNVSRLTQTTSDATAVASGKVTGLQERSEKIHEVVDLINGIAGQINLLALNATIEAARAGEAGKGFAVVAHEVKQLADQTAKATDDISRVIGQVSGDVSEVVDAIGVISRSIVEVNANSSAVAAAVEEQSAALNEISRNVNEVSQQTSGVAQNVQGVESKVGETRNVAQSVNKLSRALESSSKDLSGTIDAFIREVANDTGPSRATG